MSKLTALVLEVGLLVGAGCASPEASRSRGHGPGADVGNRGPVVEYHAGAFPYHNTPCRTKPVPCEGPLPVFSGKPAQD